MRALALLMLAVIGAALCTGAVAQDRGHVRVPRSLAPPAATTGSAPREPANQAPIGHRQPTAADVPSQTPTGPTISPYDQEIDRNLNICRGC
jgi:hypothetical protein